MSLQVRITCTSPRPQRRSLEWPGLIASDNPRQIHNEDISGVERETGGDTETIELQPGYCVITQSRRQTHTHPGIYVSQRPPTSSEDAVFCIPLFNPCYVIDFYGSRRMIYLSCDISRVAVWVGLTAVDF